MVDDSIKDRAMMFVTTSLYLFMKDTLTDNSLEPETKQREVCLPCLDVPIVFCESCNKII